MRVDITVQLNSNPAKRPTYHKLSLTTLLKQQINKDPVVLCVLPEALIMPTLMAIKKTPQIITVKIIPRTKSHKLFRNFMKTIEIV